MKNIAVVLLLLSMLVSTWFANYTSDSMLDSANNLAERSIITDKSENPTDYNLDDNVLRQEIGLVAMRIAELEKQTSCSGLFSDLTATTPNDWACVHIEPLVQNELISANDVFRPEDNITKSESLKMLIKAIGYDFEYDSESDILWQKQYVDFAVGKNIIEEFTDYDTLASRGWVFTVAAHTIEVKEEEERAEEEENKKIDEKLYSDEAILEIENLLELF